jgi:hypothetical protein
MLHLSSLADAGTGSVDVLNLPTLAQMRAKPCAPQKGLPPVLEKKERKKSKEQQAEEFRAAVWKRDGGKSRATGKKLVKSGTTDWAHLGEVDHAIPRSIAPDRLYDVSNGLLLSKEENRLRKVACVETPEHRVFDYTGPDDRALPQTFTWRDRKTGRILNTRIA